MGLWRHKCTCGDSSSLLTTPCTMPRACVIVFSMRDVLCCGLRSTSGPCCPTGSFQQRIHQAPALCWAQTLGTEVSQGDK